VYSLCQIMLRAMLATNFHRFDKIATRFVD